MPNKNIKKLEMAEFGWCVRVDLSIVMYVCTILVGNIDTSEIMYTCEEWIYRESLYLMLSFAGNLKLL